MVLETSATRPPPDLLEEDESLEEALGEPLAEESVVADWSAGFWQPETTNSKPRDRTEDRNVERDKIHLLKKAKDAPIVPEIRKNSESNRELCDQSAWQSGYLPLVSRDGRPNLFRNTQECRYGFWV
jgi:hypothetical protein